ncbi:MAG TPA: hypothetical protein VF988_07795, partial [Verrucomicrobiae bacterium]
SMIKVPPVMLGAPAQAELWPHSIWPGRIPGQLPVGLRMNNFFQVTGKNRNNFVFVPGGPAPTDPAIPRTDFETGLFSIFTAGNFGSGIAFWVDDDFSVAGANSNGGLGDGYLRFVDLSRFVHLPKDSLSLRAGQFELDLPFSPARSWNLSGWDIYGQNNVGVPGLQFVNNVFTLDTGVQGVELSGGHHYGGYWYSFAVFNQNTSGNSANTNFVPNVTGANFQSDSNFKDLYGHFQYRFNLERDPKSRHEVQAAGATGPRDHTYLELGGFYLYGRSAQRVIGTSLTAATACVVPAPECVLLTAHEPFYRVGADFSFNYRTFNLFGQWIHGRDHNLVPVDATLTPVDLTATPIPTTTVGFVHGSPATFTGGFVQADYLALPWMMLIMRYDAVNSRSDFLNGAFLTTQTTRNRYTPGVQFLIRANIKASFEYQIRPEQQIIGGTDPVTGATVNIPPFRVNTAVAGLEFVY